MTALHPQQRAPFARERWLFARGTASPAPALERDAGWPDDFRASIDDEEFLAMGHLPREKSAARREADEIDAAVCVGMQERTLETAFTVGVPYAGWGRYADRVGVIEPHLSQLHENDAA